MICAFFKVVSRLGASGAAVALFVAGCLSCLLGSGLTLGCELLLAHWLRLACVASCSLV